MESYIYILKNIVWQLPATGPLLLLHRNKQVSERFLQATNVFCYAAAMLYVSTVRLLHLGNPAVTLVNSGYLLLLLLLLLLLHLLLHRRSLHRR